MKFTASSQNIPPTVNLLCEIHSFFKNLIPLTNSFEVLGNLEDGQECRIGVQHGRQPPAQLWGISVTTWWARHHGNIAVADDSCAGPPPLLTPSARETSRKYWLLANPLFFSLFIPFPLFITVNLRPILTPNCNFYNKLLITPNCNFYNKLLISHQIAIFHNIMMGWKKFTIQNILKKVRKINNLKKVLKINNLKKVRKLII